jgi:nucleoside 2-deoxyribosyltransferase
MGGVKMQAMKSIYLSGPFSGLSLTVINDWRIEVKNNIAKDIRCIDPLRDDPDLAVVKKVRSSDEALNDLTHGMRTVTRNRTDIMNCDLLLANLLQDAELSVGTIGEIFWADAFRKPIILLKKNNSIYNHAMLDAICQWKFTTLKEAIAQINTMLSVAPNDPY